MKQVTMLVLLVLLFIQNSSAQDKIIKDTLPSWRQQQIEKIGLRDLTKSPLAFAFRLDNGKQVVEIFKDKGKLYGVVTNYIFHQTKTHDETLSNKILLDSAMVSKIYELIQQSGIPPWPTSYRRGTRFQQMKSGGEYMIELADTSGYQYINYTLQEKRGSIPELEAVENLLYALSDTLKLSETYKEFEKKLYPTGCYSSGGQYDRSYCYFPEIYTLGYWGSGRLPFGFRSSAYFEYIGKINAGLTLDVQYKFDAKRNFALEFGVSRLIRLFGSYRLLSYNYKMRKLNFVDSGRLIQNHQLVYETSIKNKLLVSFGGEYMRDDKSKIGGVFALSKWFSKPHISIDAAASIFKNDINYRVGVSKRIDFDSKIGTKFKFFIPSMSVELFFEKFKNYNDLNLSFKVQMIKVPIYRK